ncbi:MAG: phage replisome organizer N-terminal domain-containing protein [Clostridia bacterium]|nr:phage replisome organizer N-terminal domain-containing protein [Clostridia bacterium]
MSKNDGKRFYWLKLTQDFFKRKDTDDSDAIQLLLRQADGSKYVCIYLMLCLESINKGGLLYYESNGIKIPYTIEDIKAECRYYDPSEIECAVKQFLALGLLITVEISDGQQAFALPEVPKLVGTETGAAIRKRLQRNNLPLLGDNSGT